jgi:hypothetical protein
MSTPPGPNEKVDHAVNTSSPYLQAPPPPATGLGIYRLLSPRAAVMVSPIQLGGMSFGDTWSYIAGDNTKDSVFRLLDAYVDAGGNFLDTYAVPTWVAS